MCNLSTFLGVALGLRTSKRACVSVWRWGGGWNLDPDRMEVQLQVARGPWSERRACARRGGRSRVTATCERCLVDAGENDVHDVGCGREQSSATVNERIRILASCLPPDADERYGRRTLQSLVRTL